jgi:hypothetical protein
MTKIQNKKAYDLENRTEDFARNVRAYIKLYQKLYLVPIQGNKLLKAIKKAHFELVFLCFL